MSTVTVLNRYVHGASTGGYRSPEQQEQDHQNLFKDGPGLTLNDIKAGKTGRGTPDDPVRYVGDLTIPELSNLYDSLKDAGVEVEGKTGTELQVEALRAQGVKPPDLDQDGDVDQEDLRQLNRDNPDLLKGLTQKPEPTAPPSQDIALPDGADQEEAEQPRSWGELRDHYEGLKDTDAYRNNVTITVSREGQPPEEMTYRQYVDSGLATAQAGVDQVLQDAKDSGIETEGRTFADVERELREAYETYSSEVSKAFTFLAERGGYDTDDMTDAQALDAYRREVGGQGLGSVSLDQLNAAYRRAFQAGDVAALARLRDSGLGDNIPVKIDGQEMSYTQWLSRQTNRLADFQRGGFEIDPDHDAQQMVNARNDWNRYQDWRNQEIERLTAEGRIDDGTGEAEIDRILQAESTAARNVATVQNVNYLESQGVFTDDMDNTEVLVRGQQESKDDLVWYLRRSGADETFLANASMDDLQQAAGFQKQVDELAQERTRQRLLSMLPDDIDPTFAREGSVMDLALLVRQQNLVNRQRIDAQTPNLGLDVPGGARPNLTGEPTADDYKAGLEWAEDAKEARQDRAIAVAEGLDEDRRADRTEREARDLDAAIDRAAAELKELAGTQAGIMGYEHSPQYKEYARLRTERDGPNWEREEIADSAEQFLEDTRIGTVDVGGVWDAAKAPITGEHRSQWDSEIPVGIDAGLLPVVGTVADVGIRGRDGFSRSDLAWIGGMGALDVVPIPGGQVVGGAARGTLRVIRHPLDSLSIATGGRRTLGSLTQGTLDAPYQIIGSRNKLQGVSNIPVRMGDRVIMDGQELTPWQGLLRQRDIGLSQYQQTGQPQFITLRTADGGYQTVAVGGSRVATEYGAGGMVHTSPFSGEIARQSREVAEGAMPRMKYSQKTGLELPDIEQGQFYTTQAVPSFFTGTAFTKNLTPEQREIFSPGAYTLTTRENLADIEDINKVFGGDVDTGQMNPSAVVELEAKSPLDRAMAGGDKPALFQERPAGLGKQGGETFFHYVDRPAGDQSGRLRVLQTNILAAVDNLRGRTDSFYVTRTGPDGRQQVFRASDLKALADEGLTPDDAIRLHTSRGEIRLLTPREFRSGFNQVMARPGVRTGIDGTARDPSVRDGDMATPRDGDLPSPRDGDLPAPRDGDMATPRDGDLATPRDGDLPAPRDGDLATQGPRPPRDGDIPAPRDGDIPAPRDGDIPHAQGRRHSHAQGRRYSHAQGRRYTRTHAGPDTGPSAW